jgi:hypothetical protein
MEIIRMQEPGRASVEVREAATEQDEQELERE